MIKAGYSSTEFEHILTIIEDSLILRVNIKKTEDVDKYDLINAIKEKFCQAIDILMEKY